MTQCLLAILLHYNNLIFFCFIKGPFIDYTITESSPEGAFQLTLHGSLLSYEIKQVGKFKATVSDCTCWKHFIAVKTTANAVQFYENGKKLSSVLLEVPASTITETNLLVSPLKSFRNFAWWNFALNDAEASDVYNKGNYQRSQCFLIDYKATVACQCYMLSKCYYSEVS